MSMKRNITLAATVVVMLGGFAEPADACCKFLKDFAEGAVNVVEKGVGGAVKVVGGVVGGAVEVGEEVVGGAVEVGEEVVGGAVEVAGEAVDFALDVTEDTVEVVGEVTSDVLEDTLDTVKVGGETVDFALDVLEIIGEVLDPEVPEAPVATIISRPADENPSSDGSSAETRPTVTTLEDALQPLDPEAKRQQLQRLREMRAYLAAGLVAKGTPVKVFAVFDHNGHLSGYAWRQSNGFSVVPCANIADRPRWCGVSDTGDNSGGFDVEAHKFVGPYFVLGAWTRAEAVQPLDDENSKMEQIERLGAMREHLARKVPQGRRTELYALFDKTGRLSGFARQSGEQFKLSLCRDTPGRPDWCGANVPHGDSEKSALGSFRAVGPIDVVGNRVMS